MYLTADKANKETDEFRLELIFFKDDYYVDGPAWADSAQKTTYLGGCVIVPEGWEQLVVFSDLEPIPRADSGGSYWGHVPPGLVAILLGLLNCTGIFFLQGNYLIAGIWQMLAGFVVLVCEAPCCCFFIDYVQTFSDKMESRPYWNKAILYAGLALPPFFLCFFSFGTLFGSGLIFCTGVLYGMMALGKKASAEDMRSSAATIEAGLGQSNVPHSNLVSNMQPTSITTPPKAVY
ncbi:Calcium channel flower [Eumeta japonica]|uniref:Calcium channel flower n=1 Tax=Eumeta variegata TaxID=151549 RepID=A0A4C1Z7I7_EUMVA|nr:Calcium channel flower [Eumeta japonica]